nr:lipocalin-like domain-containing protein [Mycobacterium angelicum]
MLESFVSRSAGGSRHPLGQNPFGLILYTVDGYMSAQLTSDSGDEYIAYSGRFHVDEASSTVRHDVLVSNTPELLGQSLFRRAHLDGDRLTLSASVTSSKGRTINSTLVWRREQTG